MGNFMPKISDEEYDATRAVIIQNFLTRDRVEVSAHATLGHEDHLQIFLKDIKDDHWPGVFVTVMVDVPDLAAAVQAYLAERFPWHAIPPLTVVRR